MRSLGYQGLTRRKPKETTDSIRWTDTDIMLADPLTKSMSSDELTEAMRTNKLDLAQPIESLPKKRIKRSQRAAAKKDKKKGAVAAEAGEVAIDLIICDYDY